MTSSVLDRLPKGSRVAIVRLRSLGDCVLTTPAIHILKSARPDLEIGVVVEDRFLAIFENNPDISVLLPPRQLDLIRFRPTLCLNLHGGITSTRLTAFSLARYRAGFAHFRQSFVYNIRIPRAQQILRVDRKVHTVEHLASAIFYLGAQRTEIPRAQLFADPPSERVRMAKPYAVIHPLASESAKTWPAAWFLNVAQHLKRSLDLEPVFIGGPGEDLSAFQMWRVITNAPLTDIKSLLRNASLFIGNDSGPAHMAAAFGLPIVVIFGPSDAEVWGPWHTTAEVLTAGGPIHSISENQVVRALGRLRVHA